MMVLTDCPDCGLVSYWDNPYEYNVTCPNCNTVWSFTKNDKKSIGYDKNKINRG